MRLTPLPHKHYLVERTALLLAALVRAFASMIFKRCSRPRGANSASKKS